MDRSKLTGAVASVWRGIDFALRLLFTLLLLAILIFLLTMLASDGKPGVPERAALLVAPVGQLVEEQSGFPAERALLKLIGQEPPPETTMKPLLEAIRAARDDERIEALVLDLDRLVGGGVSKLRAIGAEIESFRESGKPVIATSDSYLQSQYYLASQADEVMLHHEGLVLLTGFGSYRNYYREALDRLEVEWNVFRVGEYKSAVEPYLRNDMSPEAREARREWLGDLWSAFRDDVARAREIAPEAIDEYVDTFHLKLAESGGDAAEAALAAGLVDRLVDRDEVRDRLIELVGEDEDEESYSRIGYRNYLSAVGPAEREGEDAVAVVVAAGTILDGTQPPGTIGGDSTARLIRKAREADDVKALVLRVDSPGGSAFASEIIRREIVLTKEAGIPVVSSMGSVAASGGYWISMSTDRILASPTTLTGSIGIYAMLPTAEKTLAKIGISTDGVGTGPVAGALRPDLDLRSEVKEAIQLMIDQGYRDFVTRAAEGRGMSYAEIDAIARGRVWSGTKGLDLGLVDQLGGFEDAVEAAAEMAELGDEYRIRYFRREPDTKDRLLGWLLGQVADRLPSTDGSGLGARSGGWLERFARDLEPLSDVRDPLGLWAYCYCETE